MNSLSRAATPSDVDRLAEIHVCGWRYAYRGILSDRMLFRDRLVSGSASMFRSALERSPDLWVEEDTESGIVRGFIWMGPSRDEDLPGHAEVLALYVQPEFTRIGVGTSLLSQAIERARDQKFQGVFLWVLKANHKGVAFYEKVGFVADGKTKSEELAEQTEEIRMVLSF